MFEFFNFISGLLNAVIIFISDTVTGLISLLSVMFRAALFVRATIDALPPFCKGAFVVIMAISILTVVLGMFLDFG